MTQSKAFALAAFAVAYWYSHDLTAQTSLQTSIYFASGKSSLDNDAQKKLDSFLLELQKVQDFELDIKAYTDDIGDETMNQKLAQSRAQSVLQQFEYKNIRATKQEVLGIGEQTLADTLNDAASQRQRNRRVDVVVSIFQPQNLEDFFSYFGKRKTQDFTCSNQKDTCIFTPKGTSLRIPAKAFCTKNGSPAQEPIHIELREAYTFGDMILQNLTTVSNGKMLQTGGMIHISAIDANGQELTLAPNKTLELGMPNPDTLSRMQIFTDTRTLNNNAQASNWIPQAVGFRNIDYSWVYSLFNDNNLNHLRKFKPVVYPQTASNKCPQAPFAEPNKQKEPTLTLLKPQMPKLEVLKQQNPRKKQRRRQYNKAMETLFQKKMAEYQAAVEENKKRRTVYDSSLVSYRLYTDSLIIYGKYADNLDAYLYKYIYEQQAPYAQAFAYVAELESIIKTRSNEPSNTNARYQELWYKAERIKQTCQKYKITDLDTLAAKITAQLNHPSFYRKSISRSDYQNYHKQILAVIKWMKVDSFYFDLTGSRAWTTYAVENIRTALPNPNELRTHILYHKSSKIPFDAWWVRFQAKYQQFEQNNLLKLGLDSLHSIVHQINREENFGKLADKTAADTTDMRLLANELMSNITTMDSLVKCHPKMKKAIQDARNQQVMQEKISQIAQINRLGWINCDRFLSYPADQLMHAQVDCEQESNTKFFMIFPNEKCILDLQANEKGYITQYQGVPKNAQVKLVGFRITAEGKTQLFTQQTKVSDIATIKVAFKSVSVKELNTVFANI